MENDVDLIFSRLKDRLADLTARMRRVSTNYKFIEQDLTDVNAEVEDVRRDLRTLNQDLGRQDEILLEVNIGLGDQIRQNGLMVGKQWRLSSSRSGKSFFISDTLTGGYYRFMTTNNVRDVATLPL